MTGLQPDPQAPPTPDQTPAAAPRLEVRSYEGGLHEVVAYLPDGLTDLEVQAVEATTGHNVVNVLGGRRALIWQSVLKVAEGTAS